jgi:SNF2 family DNA or RNA helicase
VSGGKADRLVELLESIFDAGESALVFSQYVKVGEKIKTLLEKKFARKIPFLHGGLSPAARDSQISAFNGSEKPTAFVLSLKAGGFGLNLTKATHVIHYDRWWNPAVENQATDRAHRIGQSRTVFVHLFVSHGTLEDRIDRILEDKRMMAGELVVSGESFLLKMSDREFAKTVGLS